MYSEHLWCSTLCTHDMDSWQCWGAGIFFHSFYLLFNGKTKFFFLLYALWTLPCHLVTSLPQLRTCILLFFTLEDFFKKINFFHSTQNFLKRIEMQMKNHRKVMHIVIKGMISCLQRLTLLRLTLIYKVSNLYQVLFAQNKDPDVHHHGLYTYILLLPKTGM